MFGELVYSDASLDVMELDMLVEYKTACVSEDLAARGLAIVGADPRFHDPVSQVGGEIDGWVSDAVAFLVAA